MDTVILTNNVATSKNEAIKLVVVKNHTDTDYPKLNKAINGIDTYQENRGGFNSGCKLTSSIKIGCSQTPNDIRGQGDSKNIFNIQPNPTEKKMLFGTPDMCQRQTSRSTASLANTSSTILLPRVANAARDYDVLEEMKRKLSQTFVRQQTFQPFRVTNDPKSSCVPGTDYEYRTPGAHYKNKNGKIKRPMNAFMVWAREYRGHLASSMLNATNSEISVKLGQIWANMAAEDKKQYYDVAEKIKAKHRKDYPGWVYQPSAQTLKKKDETHTYTRTPTPPPHVMLSSLGPTGSVIETAVSNTFCDKTSSLVPGLNNDDQQNAAMPQLSIISDTSTGSSRHVRPLYVTRVSYQSTLELPTENTVSETTRDLLASKLSLGKSQSVSATELSPAPLTQSYYQQRAPFVKRSYIPTMAPQNVGPSTASPSSVKPVGFFSPNVSGLNTSKMQANLQPRVMGIVTPPPLGKLQVQNNVRLHAVRPSLLQELLPNAHMRPHVTPNKQYELPRMVPIAPQTTRKMVPDSQQRLSYEIPGTPFTNQTPTKILQGQSWTEQRYPGSCVPKDIPIVETHISPISARVRSVKLDTPEKLVSHQTSSCSDESEAFNKGQTQTTIPVVNAKRDDECSNDLHEGSRDLSSKLEDCWKTDNGVDELWPFPFSDNPADWDVKEVPSSLYMELFDPYDPFLNTDTLLSEKFPGSLQLDMEKWKRYLEDDEDGTVDSDPLNPLNDDKADDFVPSPLPLKQTLCRLLNADVQASDTGDIITGDLVTEVTITGKVDNYGEEFETRKLLTKEMANELTCILKAETENSFEEERQNAKHILNSIIDKIENVENTESSVSETREKVRHETESKETGAEAACFGTDDQSGQIVSKKCQEGKHEFGQSDLSNPDSETSKVKEKSVKSETLDTESDENLSNATRCMNDSSESKCSKCVEILNDTKKISREINNNVADDDTYFVDEETEANNCKMKTSSNIVTISRNNRPRTRSKKLTL